jgi:hypothetical protein
VIDGIEVYIRLRKLKVGKAVYVGAPSDGIYFIAESTHYCMDKEKFKNEELIPEADVLALKVVSEFAKEKGLLLKICNVSTFKGRMKAYLKRINKTPLVIIGKSRIDGEYVPELLKSKLESCFSK